MHNALQEYKNTGAIIFIEYLQQLTLSYVSNLIC